MKIRRMLFKTCLVLCLVAGLASCATEESRRKSEETRKAEAAKKKADEAEKKRKEKEKEEATVLRLYMEVNADGTSRTGAVPVYRASPMMINIDLSPLLTEAEVDSADVIDEMGTFSIKIQFAEGRGSRLLQYASTYNRNRRVAVFANFGEPRWLAAPIMTQLITNGTFVFTPDATRQESERIVRGLNNVAKEIKKKNKI